MARLKPEYEDLRMRGEQYTCDVAGPFEMRLDAIISRADFWSTCRGTHQGRPCMFRFATVANWHLEGTPSAAARHDFRSPISLLLNVPFYLGQGGGQPQGR
jgi:hypothetical protein